MKKKRKFKISNKIYQQYYSYTEKELEEIVIPKTLMKVQSLLVNEKCADSLRSIKSKNIIEIKDTASNGKERLIGKEIRELYDLNYEEAEKEFDVIFPIWNEGVIRYDTNRGGHYTHFKVISSTDKVFTLNIREYKYYHGIFYLTYEVLLENITKISPISCGTKIGKDVRTILDRLDIKTKAELKKN